MPARKFPCPLCINEEASIPSKGPAICDACGKAIGESDPRVLLVSRSSFHTFCTPDCLKEYQKVDELYTKKGSTRESEP
jgi:hypothetical protein